MKACGLCSCASSACPPPDTQLTHWQAPFLTAHVVSGPAGLCESLLPADDGSTQGPCAGSTATLEGVSCPANARPGEPHVAHGASEGGRCPAAPGQRRRVCAPRPRPCPTRGLTPPEGPWRASPELLYNTNGEGKRPAGGAYTPRGPLSARPSPRLPVPAQRQGRPLGTSSTPSTVKGPLPSCSRAEPPRAPPRCTSSTVPCIHTARRRSGARPASARHNCHVPPAPRTAPRSWAASTFTGGPGASPAMLSRREAADPGGLRGGRCPPRAAAEGGKGREAARGPPRAGGRRWRRRNGPTPPEGRGGSGNRGAGRPPAGWGRGKAGRGGRTRRQAWGRGGGGVRLPYFKITIGSGSAAACAPRVAPPCWQQLCRVCAVPAAAASSATKRST